MALAIWKYQKHRAQSKFRGIDFLLTFEEWYNWWLQNGVDKNQDVKWTGKGRPCMCRKGDTGPYELNNIYFATNSDNAKDLTKHGRLNSRGRFSAKNYRYGKELVTRNELVTKYKIQSKLVPFFKADRYDFENEKLSRKLHHRYFNLMKTHVKEFEGANGQWFESRNQAAESLKVSIHHYVGLLDRNKVSRRMRQIVPDFIDFLKEHTIFPDPFIPEFNQNTMISD